MINFVVSNLADTEKVLSRTKGSVNRGKVKDTAKEAARDAGRAVNKAFSWIPKLGKRLKKV